VTPDLDPGRVGCDERRADGPRDAPRMASPNSAGGPRKALRAFRQRRIQIEKRLARDGLNGTRAA
jgi:hypothetical protein